MKMFIGVTATQTMESVAKVKKSCDFHGWKLKQTQKSYNAFEFSYQRNAMDGDC